MDKYEDFAELKRNESEGYDYIILYRKAVSGFAIMAPHGGGIEPGTLDIADAVAGYEHTFYAFKGIKKSGNSVLHISSNRYDEPTGLKVSKNALVVVSIHGSKDKNEIVSIGGKNDNLKMKIMDSLRKNRFKAVISVSEGFRGICPENICNRCRSGKGVQLEISRGLRERIFENLDRRSLRKKTVLFYKFVDIIKETLRNYNACT
jgi:phage replication-related protein YjqB (UPF0714/DUF867 family)